MPAIELLQVEEIKGMPEKEFDAARITRKIYIEEREGGNITVMLLSLKATRYMAVH